MSWPKFIYVVSMRSIYVVSMRSIFQFVINHIRTSKQRYLFFVNFLEYRLFLDDNADEENELISNSKVQPQGAA